MAPTNKKPLNPSSIEDIDPILAPISKDNPAGISLRYEGIYDKIREARREEDPHLPQGVWQRSIKRSNFKEVEKLCINTLTKESKDFQVMAWLIEAWFELYKLKGFIKGFDLCAQLCSRYWDNAYPSIYDNDIEYRLSPFHWLNEKFSQKIFLIPFAEPTTDTKRTFSYRDWKDALERERLLQKIQGNETSQESMDRPILQEVQDAINHTSNNFYISLKSDLLSAISKIEGLENFLLQKTPLADISLYQLKKNLKTIQTSVMQILAQQEEGHTSEEPDINISHETTPSSHTLEEAFLESPKPLSFTEDSLHYFDHKETLDTTSPLIKSNNLPTLNPQQLKITTREEAYVLLKIVMDFLMKTEPHSPAPYLIRRAISWGNKTLEDLFQELLEETGDLNQLLSLLGIRPKNTDLKQ